MIKAFDELKEKHLIDGYHFVKNKKYESSFFEIFFDKKHNKNLYAVHKTGQEEMKIIDIKEGGSRLSFASEIATEKKQIYLEEFEKLIEEQLEKTRRLNLKRELTRKQAEEYLLQEYEIID